MRAQRPSPRVPCSPKHSGSAGHPRPPPNITSGGPPAGQSALRDLPPGRTADGDRRAWEAFRHRGGEIVRTYCIITVPAMGAVVDIDYRMPSVLDDRDWAVWLGDAPGDPTTLWGRRQRHACAEAGRGGRLRDATSTTRESRPCVTSTMPTSGLCRLLPENARWRS